MTWLASISIALNLKFSSALLSLSVPRARFVREGVVALRFLPGVLQHLCRPERLERSQFVRPVVLALLGAPAGPGSPQTAAPGAPGHAAHQQLQRGHGQDQRRWAYCIVHAFCSKHPAGLLIEVDRKRLLLFRCSGRFCYSSAVYRYAAVARRFGNRPRA